MFTDLDLPALGFSVTEHAATEYATISCWREYEDRVVSKASLRSRTRRDAHVPRMSTAKSASEMVRRLIQLREQADRGGSL